MFSLVLATTASLYVRYMPFVTPVMVVASFGFATLSGYQTNLIVYDLGGYKFSDHLKFGVPIDLLVELVAVTTASFVWPF